MEHNNKNATLTWHEINHKADDAQITTAITTLLAEGRRLRLIWVLEGLLLHPASRWASDSRLQILLITMAIEEAPSRVAKYVYELDNYDGPRVARICVADAYKLYEEGFEIFKKFGCGVEALEVLLYKLNDVSCACRFAAFWNTSEVWRAYEEFISRSQQNFIDE